MKKLIIVMAILLTSCVEKRVEVNDMIDIGGKPDFLIHKMGNHQVLTFTFEQDGHKYNIWLEYTTKVELIW